MKLINPRMYDPKNDYHGIDYVPVGFQHIETAPRDGSWIRLRFRRRADEVEAQWQYHAEMTKTGGSWFDREGFYVTPGPLFWAPLPDRLRG